MPGFSIYTIARALFGTPAYERRERPQRDINGDTFASYDPACIRRHAV